MHIRDCCDFGESLRIPSRYKLLAAVALASFAIAASGAAQPASNLHVSTLAGTPGSPFNAPVDGLGSAARFSLPFGIAFAPNGDLYVADSYNNAIRLITRRGEVTTVAGTSGGFVDGQGAAARFNNPGGMALDESTGELYISDTFNNVIRKMTPLGLVTTIAGLGGVSGNNDGVGTAARFNFPRDIAVVGHHAFVVDSSNHSVRRITIATGQVTTLAGSAALPGYADGMGAAARFYRPHGIAFDESGDGSLVVADYGNQVIRRVSLTGRVDTIAGAAGVRGSADGIGGSARFYQPAGVAVDSAGNMYITDTYNHTLRKITPTGLVSTLAGSPGEQGSADGFGPAARFSGPHGVVVDAAGHIYVADTSNTAIRVVAEPHAPAINGALTDTTLDPGIAAEVTVGVTASIWPVFEWFKDDQPISGATTDTLRFESPDARDTGVYSVTLTNPFGTIASDSFVVTVRAPPLLTSLSDAVTLSGEANTTLSVAAVGARPFAYQWYRGGIPVAGVPSSTLSTAIPGVYSVGVTNSYGTIISNGIHVRPAKRLVNLATRGSVVGTEHTLIAGFAVRNDDATLKQFLIRGVGPTLTKFGVNNPLARPRVTLYREAFPAGSNAGWSTGSAAVQLAETAQAVGAFALDAGSADAALIATLAPGNYTVEIAGIDGASGDALVEIYEMAAELNRLVNLSTRGRVTISEPLTAGMVISGTAAMKLLVRAVGPGLAAFGVGDAVARPQLKVYSGGNVIATNAGWETAADPDSLAAAAGASGAFPFEAGSADCAVLLTLMPGGYTAEITGIDSAGVALVEVYEVP